MDSTPVIKQFHRGLRLEAVPLLVVEANTASTREQKPFTRYTLKDRSGTIPGIRWHHQADPAEQGAVALVTGTVDEYRGQPQLKVTELTIVEQPDVELLNRLTTSLSPEMLETLRETMRQAHDELPDVFWAIFSRAVGHDPLDPNGAFWAFAAAQSKHHAMPGGLAWHVLTMYAEADDIARHYPLLDIDLLKLAVLTHDLGKFDCYVMGATGARMLDLDRTVGHTSYSMQRVYAAIQSLRAEGWEIAAADEHNLLHAIAAHHGRKEWGAVQEPNSAEAAALHALDLLDSQLRGQTDPRPGPPPDRRHAAPAGTSPPPARHAGDNARPATETLPEPFDAGADLDHADPVAGPDPFADDSESRPAERPPAPRERPARGGRRSSEPPSTVAPSPHDPPDADVAPEPAAPDRPKRTTAARRTKEPAAPPPAPGPGEDDSFAEPDDHPSAAPPNAAAGDSAIDAADDDPFADLGDLPETPPGPGEPAEDEEDPFQIDDDDPFDDAPASASEQPSLFDP